MQHMLFQAATLGSYHPSTHKHWLPGKYHIWYKILLLAYETQNHAAPVTLSDALSPYIPACSLCSEQHYRRVHPKPRLHEDGDRRFMYVSLDTEMIIHGKTPFTPLTSFHPPGITLPAISPALTIYEKNCHNDSNLAQSQILLYKYQQLMLPDHGT